MRFPGHETVSIGNRVRVNDAMPKSIAGPFQVIKCPTLGKITRLLFYFSEAFIMLLKLYVNMV